MLYLLLRIFFFFLLFLIGGEYMTALILSFFLISSPILEDVAPVVYDFPSPESVYDAQTDSED